ncbi:MAG: ABC transporter permease [Chloroflexota bacterium]
MNAFAVHFSFEFRSGLRNKTLLLMNYLLPLGFYAMMGLTMAEINPLFRPVMVPAMVIFAVLSGAILGLPDPLVTAREAGIFRSYKINGVPALSILLMPTLSTLFHVAIAAAIIAATAPALFGATPPAHWGNFVLVTLAMMLASAGLGLLIGVVSASSRVTVLWSQLIYLPSMMLGGLMLPTEMLPAALARVSLLLPSTHAMAAYQGLAMGQSAPLDPYLGLATLVAGGALACALALFLFNWDRRNATRRGHPALALLALAPYALAMLAA